MSKILIRRLPLSIAWELITDATAAGNQFPRWTSFQKPVYSSVSGTSLWWLHRDTSSIIFSTDLYSYHANTRAWTRLGGTGAPIATCTDGSGSTDIAGNPKLPWPSDRHPVEQMAIDTTRNRLHIVQGVCNGAVPRDHMTFSLEATPANGVWSTFLTGVENMPGIEATGSLEYLADPDIFVLHGRNTGSFPVTWVLCPGTGFPSEAQQAAGCIEKGVWYQTYSTGTQNPANSEFAHLVALPGTGTVLHFGYANGNCTLWEYTVATKTWVDKAPSGCPDETSTVGAPERLVSYITSGALAGKVYYRQTAHLGTPSTPHGDFLYRPSSNTFTPLASTGVGPRTLTYCVFDPTLGPHGGIVAIANDDELWHGVFS